MPVTTCTFTGTWTLPGNTPASGAIEFIPAAATRQTNAGTTPATIVPLETLRFTLDANGKLNGVTGVTLIRVAGGYKVTEYINGALPYSYTVADAAGPIDLSTQA